MVATVEPLNLEAMTREDAEVLWGKVRQQKACFDDFTRDRGDVFAARLVNPSSAVFQLDNALVLVESIVPRLSAEIHFYMWKAMRDIDAVSAARDICRYIFDTYKIHRLSAYPPAFNQAAQRIAVRLGFKWEGCMRQQFLYEGKYHDVCVYGLLAQEFNPRVRAIGGTS